MNTHTQTFHSTQGSTTGEVNMPPANPAIDDDYNFHDSSFRRHYQLHYAGASHEYETFYAPAYRYGYQLSAENSGAAWEQVASKAQEHWSSMQAGAWAEVADAIRYGWTEERHPDKLRVHHHGQLEDYRPSFEAHFADALHETGLSFAQFEPIYSYGYGLAIDPDYHDRLWPDVEPEVKAMWENEYHSRFMWEGYRDAVRHAWEEVRAGSSH